LRATSSSCSSFAFSRSSLSICRSRSSRFGLGPRGFGSKPFDGEGVGCTAFDLIDKGVLTLDVPAPPEPEDRRYRYAEYRSGGYHREFRISEDIDREGISARMRHGVLELRLPKSAETRPRRITVEAA